MMLIALRFSIWLKKSRSANLITIRKWLLNEIASLSNRLNMDINVWIIQEHARRITCARTPLVRVTILLVDEVR